MKTNAKKRMLISSVAMLLVAMLALGTATFAWFTQNTSATTKNLGVYTSKSSSLQISKSNAAWGSEVDYDFANKKLLPASTTNGADWFAAVAKSESSYATDKGLAESITLTNGKNTTYLFKEQLNIRNAGSAAVKDVKIKFTIGQSNDYDYLRVALVPVESVGPNVAIPSTVTFTDHVYANNSNNSSTTVAETTNYSKAYQPIKAVSNKTATLATAFTPNLSDSDTGLVTVDVTGTDEQLAAADVKNNIYATKCYNLYVWFEGQDIQCLNENGGATIPNITFSVEGTTVDE